MDSQTQVILFLILAFVAIFLITFGIHAFADRCPNCKKWMALYQTDEQKISEEGAYKTVNRSDYVSIGDKSGWIDRKEQVHIIRSWYNIKLQCKHCGSKFEKKEKREVEG